MTAVSGLVLDAGTWCATGVAATCGIAVIRAHLRRNAEAEARYAWMAAAAYVVRALLDMIAWNWPAAARAAALAVVFLWLWWRKRKDRKKALRALGYKARARLEAMVRSMPRLSPRLVPEGVPA